MNNPVLAAEKLKELIALAEKASNDFEKSAVYGAMNGLVREFEEGDVLTGYGFEKLEYVRWGIAGALGFDTTNDKSKDGMISMAYGQVESLIDVCKQIRN